MRAKTGWLANKMRDLMKLRKGLFWKRRSESGANQEEWDGKKCVLQNVSGQSLPVSD